MLFMSIASPSNARLFNRLSMPFPLGSYQGLSFAIPPFSLPCLSTSKLFFSILRPSLSYPFFTLLFYAFALLFNALPSPFMSIHCRCTLIKALPLPFISNPLRIKSLLVLTLPLRIKSELRLSKSSLCLSFANHYFAVHCLAVPLRTDSFLRLCFAEQSHCKSPFFLSLPCHATAICCFANPLPCGVHR